MINEHYRIDMQENTPRGFTIPKKASPPPLPPWKRPLPIPYKCRYPKTYFDAVIVLPHTPSSLTLCQFLQLILLQYIRVIHVHQFQVVTCSGSIHFVFASKLSDSAAWSTAKVASATTSYTI